MNMDGYDSYVLALEKKNEKLVRLLKQTHESIRLVDDYPKGNSVETIRGARLRIENSKLVPLAAGAT